MVCIGCCLGPGLHPSRSNTKVPGLERHRDSGTYSLAQWSLPRVRFFQPVPFIGLGRFHPAAPTIDASVSRHRAGLGAQEQAGGHDPAVCSAPPGDPKVWFRVTKWTGFDSARISLRAGQTLLGSV